MWNVCKSLSSSDRVWFELTYAAHRLWMLLCSLSKTSCTCLPAHVSGVENMRGAGTRKFEATPDFVQGGSLHPYQLEGLNWLYHKAQSRHNAILADEMGLGKTIQATAFMGALWKVGSGWQLLCSATSFAAHGSLITLLCRPCFCDRGLPVPDMFVKGPRS